MRPVHDVGMPALFVPVARVAVPLTNFLARVLPESALRRDAPQPAGALSPSSQPRDDRARDRAHGLALRRAGGDGRLGDDRRSPSSALLMLSPPLLIFSILFFTELLSALVCFAVFYRLVIADVRGTARWWWLGCLTGLLFLIHARNIGLMVPLAALALYHLRDRPRRGEAMAFAGGAALFIAVRTLVNYRFWGELVSGPHAHAAEWSGAMPLLTETATRLLGLLFDQEYGLLPYAPVYVLAVAGAFALAKTNRALTLALTLVVASLRRAHRVPVDERARLDRRLEPGGEIPDADCAAPRPVGLRRPARDAALRVSCDRGDPGPDQRLCVAAPEGVVERRRRPRRRLHRASSGRLRLAAVVHGVDELQPREQSLRAGCTSDAAQSLTNQAATFGTPGGTRASRARRYSRCGRA